MDATYQKPRFNRWVYDLASVFHLAAQAGAIYGFFNLAVIITDSTRVVRRSSRATAGHASRNRLP